MTKEELANLIKKYVSKQLEQFEMPKDGIDGKDGVDGKDGIDGRDGEKGIDGKDGINGKDGRDGESVSFEEVTAAITAGFERRFSDLQLSWERQARETFEKALDKMPVPKDGKDGKDALPLSEIDVVQDGRHVTLKLGDVERKIKLDTVIDQGVYKEGEYEKGDAVTYGGSLWIAQVDNPNGAPSTTKDWRLAVKKGRDGRDLRDNASTVDKSKGINL